MGAYDKCNCRQKVGKNTKLYVMLDLVPNFKLNFKTHDSILQNLQEFNVQILLYFCSHYSFIQNVSFLQERSAAQMHKR